MLSLVPNATNFNETTTASAATTAAHGWEWDDILPIFSEFYRPIHGYLSLLVCIFGIFANLLNIVVLTRKEMASPTNTILTGLAVADLMVMIEYIPFTIHSSIESYESPKDQYSYPWAVFTLFHAHFSVIFHSISTWLTVILAIWRYTSVSFPTESKRWCSMSNAKLTIGVTYIIVPLICIPSYLTFAIVTHEAYEEGRMILTYSIDYSEISLRNGGLLKNINFWVFSMGLKLVPCILLTYLSLALIRVLMEAEKRKQRLKNNLTSSSRDKSQCPSSNEIKYTTGSTFKSQRCMVLSSASLVDSNAPHHHHHHHHHQHHHRHQQHHRTTVASTSTKPEVILNIHEAEKTILKADEEDRFTDDEEEEEEEEEDEEEAEVNSTRPVPSERSRSTLTKSKSKSSSSSTSRATVKEKGKSKVTKSFSLLSTLTKRATGTTSAAALTSTSASASASTSTSTGPSVIKLNPNANVTQCKTTCDFNSPAITYTVDVTDESAKVTSSVNKLTKKETAADDEEGGGEGEEEGEDENDVVVAIASASTGVVTTTTPRGSTSGHLSVPALVLSGQSRQSTSSSSRRESEVTTGMTGPTSTSLPPGSNASTIGSRVSHQSRNSSSTSQSDRTTRMLLAILLLFLLTEFPSGVVTLLSGVMGENFQNNVYQPLGEVFDILALVNSAINFILYCVMSRLFRKTFCKIFWPHKYHTHYASTDRAVRKSDFRFAQTAVSTLPTQQQLDPTTTLPPSTATTVTATGNNNLALIQSKHQLHHQHQQQQQNNCQDEMEPIELTETVTRRSSAIPLTTACVPMDVSTIVSNQSTML